MRILFLTHHYLPQHVGTSATYVRGLVRRAKAEGHQVEVISHGHPPSDGSAKSGVRHINTGEVSVTEIFHEIPKTEVTARTEYDDSEIGLLVTDQISRFRPDVIHVLKVGQLTAAALIAALDSGKPVVVTLIDYWSVCLRGSLVRAGGAICNGPRHKLDCLRCARATHGVAQGPWNQVRESREWMHARWGLWQGRDKPPAYWQDVRAIRERNPFLHRLLLRADRVIAPSNFIREIVEKNGYPRKRIEVITPGIETEGLPPRRIAAPFGQPRIIFIGELNPQSGPNVLFEALARVPQLELECLVFGKGPKGAPYTQLMDQFAAKEIRLRMMGNLPPEKLGSVLAETTALAMPAQWYPYDISVARAALHSGVPLLASKTGPLAEFIRDQRDGWLLPPRNVAAWAAALKRMMKAPETLPRPHAPQKTMEEHAGEIFEIYRSLVFGWRRPVL